MNPRPVFVAAICITCLAATPSRVLAQSGFWLPTSAPSCDNITSVAFDSAGDEFAATAYGGVFRSTDGGDHWTHINAGLPDFYASALAATPDNGILVGVSGGIYRSTNAGETWFPAGGGDSLSSPNAIAADTSGWIFVSTGAAGVYRSSDGGAHWSRTRAGLADSAIKFICVRNDGQVFAGTWSAGLFHSTDFGASWMPTGLSEIPVTSLVEDTTGQLMASTIGGGIVKSTDNGVTWTQSGLPGGSVNALALTGAGWVLAGADRGLYISQDHGRSWSPVGFTSMVFTCIEVGRTREIFAGTTENGLMRSTDDGLTWDFPYNGLTSISARALLWTKSGILLAATNRAIFRSTDDGTTWKQSYKGLSTTDVTALAEGDSGLVYAGTEGNGVFRSKDGGQSWAQRGEGDIAIRSLAVNKAGDLLAAGWSVYQMKKGDSSWTRSNFPILLQTAHVLAVDSIGTVYVGTDSGGVFVSTDGGTNWRGSGMPWHPTSALTVTARQHILAGGEGPYMSRSTNGGTSWVFVPAGWSEWSVNFLATHRNGTLFAGTTGPNGGSLYTSTDEGDHWLLLGTSLSNAGVQSLTRGKGEYIFIGTEGAGILRSSQPFTSVHGDGSSLPGRFALGQNFPNPFNPTTTIRFAIPHRTHVTLSVYNLAGQCVRVLLDGDCDAGFHDVRFDATGLASGAYFYWLKAPGYKSGKKLLVVR